MTALSVVIILLGLLIALTRAPLIFAPAQTRAFYLRMFETDGRMRVLGSVIAAFGVVLAWAAAGGPAPAATIVLAVGAFMVAIGLLFFAAFPAPARRLATSVWSSFSDAVLRLTGALAVAIGLAIAAYGTSL